MIQFGMPTLIENATLEENVALCKSLDLKFIELNMNFPEYQVDKLEDTENLISQAENAGIYYTIHLDENLNIADFNYLVTDAYLETVRRSVEVTKKLIPLRDKYGDRTQPLTLNMHMNHGIYITLPDRKVQMYDRDFETYMKSFEVFRTKCEEWIGDSDIRIVIENTDGFRDYEKKAIEYLLESPKFGITWDIGHSVAVGEKDVPFILEHQDRLIHFHIHDGSEKPPKNHLALGDGEINLSERLQLAEKRNARCVLETKTVEALKNSVQWLKNYSEDSTAAEEQKLSYKNEDNARINACGTLEIDTKRLLLRAFCPADAKSVFQNWAGDENVQGMYGEPAYKTIEAVQELLNKYISGYSTGYTYRWAVIEKASGECIGQVAYFLVDKKNSWGEIEYCIGADYQGKGYATEATKAVIDYGFETIGFNKVQICVRPSNIKSKRVIEKCGFEYEGTLRDYFFINGTYEGRMYYSLLAKKG